ncbi:DUF975 family protein [Patescibacteria group bacterium]|nr:DUF975 family protein [Patescibacteria group bacterium]
MTFSFLVQPSYVIPGPEIRENVPQSLPFPINIAVNLINFLPQMFIMAFIFLGFLNLYNESNVSVKDLLKRSFKYFLGFTAVYILYMLTVGVGFILLMIPGLIFMVMFYPSIFIYLEKKPGIIESLKESKKLTSGYKWKVFWRYVSSSFLGTLIFYLPLTALGAIFMLIFSGSSEGLKNFVLPLSIFLGLTAIIYILIGMFLLWCVNLMLSIVYYKDLERIKLGNVSNPTDNTPNPDPLENLQPLPDTQEEGGIPTFEEQSVPESNQIENIPQNGENAEQTEDIEKQMESTTESI